MGKRGLVLMACSDFVQRFLLWALEQGFSDTELLLFWVPDTHARTNVQALEMYTKTIESTCACLFNKYLQND